MKNSAVLLLLAAAAVSPEIRYFQYERPLEKTSGQSCVLIEPGIFTHAAPQLADLRLYRDGTETPYVIRTQEAVERAEKELTLLNLGTRDGQTVFDASVPEGPYSNLQLNVTGENFIATVTVTGSQAESGSAETAIGTYTIFDLTGQKLGRSTILHLPESDFRFLHFRIKGPLTPQSVNGLSVMRMPASQTRYVTVAESASVRQEGHSSVLEFTVPAHVPVDRIAFMPGASPALFSRDLSVTVEPVDESKSIDRTKSQLTAISNGDILRVHSVQNGQRIDEERLAVDAPWVDSQTPTKWTVRIDNKNDVPVQLKSVQLQMLERSLCFEAESSNSYTLYYGDPALTAPGYDYARLFTPQANATRMTALAEQANPAYQPRPDSRPFTEKHPVLLWVALAAVIALLGFVAVKSAKWEVHSSK